MPFRIAPYDAGPGLLPYGTERKSLPTTETSPPPADTVERSSEFSELTPQQAREMRLFCVDGGF